MLGNLIAKVRQGLTHLSIVNWSGHAGGHNNIVAEVLMDQVWMQRWRSMGGLISRTYHKNMKTSRAIHLAFGATSRNQSDGHVFLFPAFILLPPRSISCRRLSILAIPNSLTNWICSIICQVMLCSVGNRSRSSPNRPRESYCRSLM